MYPAAAPATAHISATFVTTIASLKPYITISPAIGVAVPVALFTNPNNDTITPAAAPPIKLVTYTGIGFAEIISAYVRGSTATAIVVFLSPNPIL